MMKLFAPKSVQANQEFAAKTPRQAPKFWGLNSSGVPTHHRGSAAIGEPRHESKSAHIFSKADQGAMEQL